MNFTTNQIFKSIFCLVLSIFLTSLTAGILMVVVPNILYQNSVNSILIGLLSALEVLSAVLVISYLSRIIKIISIVKLSFITTAIYAIVVLLLFFYINYAFRVILALLIGSCWLAFLIIRISWLNNIATNSTRPLVIGLYGTAISLGFAFGPIIVKFLGVNNYLVFIIASVQVIAAFLILLPIQQYAPKNLHSGAISLKKFFINNPPCFISRFLLDAQISSIIFFTIIFGKKIGFSAENAGLLISAFMLTGLLDLVSGFFITKFNPYKVINICFGASLISFLIATVLYQSYISLIVIYFIYGIFIGTIFIATTTIINNQYKNELVAANATFQIIGSIGTFFGVLICGALMQIFDFYGLLLTIILVNITYFTLLVAGGFAKK